MTTTKLTISLALVIAFLTGAWVTVTSQEVSCKPVTYVSSQDATATYWARWDKLTSAGYHAHPGDVREELFPAGC